MTTPAPTANPAAAASAQIDQLNLIVENARDVISLHDPEGRFLYVSPSVRQLCGREATEMIGRSPFDLVHPDDRRSLLTNLALMRRGRPHADQVVIHGRLPDGSFRALEASVRAVRDQGSLQAVICICRDAGPRMAAEEDARRSQSELQTHLALRRVAVAIAEGQPALPVVATELRRVFQARAAGAYELAPGGLRLREASGDGVLLERGLPLARRVVDDGDGPVHDPALGATAVPVVLGGARWGALLVAGRTESEEPPPSASGLSSFAELAALGVRAAAARARLAAEALTDALTGLANHRAFHERLRSELARAQRHGRPLSLAILDLDHFKRFNDTHGHQAGDDALALVSKRLLQVARTGDLVARIGGEEFAWLLPEAPAQAALEAVERARRLVGEARVAGESLTISAGICDLSWASGADELFRHADGALYWAKGHGRDRACVYEPEIVEENSPTERARRIQRGQTLAALRALARAVDVREGAPGASGRVAALAARMARVLGWSLERASALGEAAALRDIGKIGLPPELLARPGSLSEGEQALVRTHIATGADIVAEALDDEQRVWIRHHHERFDAGGYPAGLAGDGIPEGSRIIAVAEAWDALRRPRPHVGARDAAAALIEIERNAGTQFCPACVGALRLALADVGEGARAGPWSAQGAEREAPHAGRGSLPGTD